MGNVPFLEVIDRAYKGAYLTQEEFDLQVFFPKLQKVLKKYDIAYQPGTLVPDDDDLADRVFEAGIDFYSQVGTYCVDTERVIHFSREEILAALETGPRRVAFGEGKDERILVGRKPESPIKPFCFLGAGGVPVSSDQVFLDLVQAYGEIELADTLTMPSLTDVNGRKVRPNGPYEILAAMRSSQLVREGLRRAGRPGMATMNAIACASSDVAKIAGSCRDLRPSDGWMIGSTAELKVELPRLNEIAFVLDMGGRILGETTPLLGGYCGGPDGVAVANVAYHLHGLMVLRGACQLSCPLPIKNVASTGAPILWAISTSAQAISRNSHVPLLTSPFMAAGPVTEMCFRETAAAVTTIVASGSNLEALICHGGATTDLLAPQSPAFAA